MKKVWAGFKKYWVKIMSAALILFVLIYVPTVAISKARDYEIYKEKEIETKIYTIWEVETFEGGEKSRIDYIKTIARTLESENDGILFMIRSIEPENLAGELELSTPDMISFGYGVGNILLDKLIPFEKTYNVRDELVESGTFSNSVYALAYIVSGYALIEHSDASGSLFVGDSDYISPQNVYSELGRTVEIQTSAYEAYKSFVYSKTGALLGTARDVYRVSNLNNIGRLSATITPIDSYTDLIQYFSVTTWDDIISEFVEKIFNSTNQQSLTNYSLFSSLYTKLYSSGIYKDMEEAITNCVVPYVFK